MPIRRLKKAFVERIRMQRLKREHERYLEMSAPRQFKEVVGKYDETIVKKIEELARTMQVRTVESPIRPQFSERELNMLEELKKQLGEIYEQLEENDHKKLLAAALHMRGHGPPYEELAKHVLKTYNKNRT